MPPLGPKERLMIEFRSLISKASEERYHLTILDAFALGYLAGKYNLNSLDIRNPKVKDACKEYDKTDELQLMDTISETLNDLL